MAPQAVHDELADFAGLALALGGLDDEGLGFIDDLFKSADWDWTLLAGAHESIKNFLAVKTLAASVFFYHHVRNFVDAFVGGEALFTLQAFAAAADGIRFLAFARIHDFVIFKPAKGAFHVLGFTGELKTIVAGDAAQDGVTENGTEPHTESFLQLRRPVCDQLERSLGFFPGMVHQEALSIG